MHEEDFWLCHWFPFGFPSNEPRKGYPQKRARLHIAWWEGRTHPTIPPPSPRVNLKDPRSGSMFIGGGRRGHVDPRRIHPSHYQGGGPSKSDESPLKGGTFRSKSTRGLHQSVNVGLGYHFESPENCYISYSNAPEEWRLDTGSSPPVSPSNPKQGSSFDGGGGGFWVLPWKMRRVFRLFFVFFETQSKGGAVILRH